MTETRLLDFSDARPSPAEIKHAGASGVMRYVTRSTGAKRVSAAEAKTYRDAGLWVGLVFEDSATRATAGHAAGVADALEAAKQARAIGYPTTAPIFFAVDESTSWASVAAYFQGVRDANCGYPVGDYGDYTIVEGAQAAGIKWHWQTVAWSNHQVSTHAHLYQRNTETVAVAGTDENVLLHPCPLWGVPAAPAPAPKPAPAPAPAPTPATVSTPMEDPMLFFAHRTDGSIFIVAMTGYGLAKRHIGPTEYQDYISGGVPNANPALNDAQINAIPDLKAAA